MTQLMNTTCPKLPTLLALCIATALSIGCNDASAPGGSATPDNVTKSPASATATADATASAEATADPSAEPSANASGATSAEPADTAKAGTTAKGDGKKVEPEEKAGKVKGDETAEAQYAVWLQSAGRYKVGKAATVQAVVVAKGAFKCNEKYPYKFKLGAPPAGVTYPEKIARKISSGTKQRTLSVPFTPTTTGKKTISGVFYFSICNEASCKIKKQPLSVTVEVFDS